MFARIGEFIPKLEQKEEFVKVVRNEVLPILKKQAGFLEILPFFPETKTEKDDHHHSLGREAGCRAL